MKKIVRLTESDLVRIVKRVLNEQSIGSGPAHSVNSKPKSNNPVCSKFVDYAPVTKSNSSRLGITDEPVFQYSAVYLEPHSNGKFEGKNLAGKKVWLNSRGFSDWKPGNTKLAYTAAKQLYDGVSGVDISGQGTKKILNVVKMWKSFDLFTQNDFLKEWYKLTKNIETPWEAIAGDYEQDLADKMIDDSKDKAQKYCPTKSTSY